MDKNTITGLVLIGLILSAFAIFNQPTEEEKKEMEAKRKQELQAQKDEAVSADTIAASEVKESAKPDTIADDKPAVKQEELKANFATIENDLMKVELSTIGGQVSRVYLKEYETYHEYVKEDGKIKPLKLFNRGDARNALLINDSGKEINTSELEFKVVKSGKRSATYRANLGQGKAVEFTYTLVDGSYTMDYNMELINLKDAINKGVYFDWYTSYKKTERLFSEQRRVSTVCFNQSEEGFDYLSETADDEEQMEDDLEWVSFKQSYFSMFLKPDRSFVGNGSELMVRNYQDGEKRKNTHLKDMQALLALDMPKSNNATLNFSWFFGPNDYEILAENGDGYTDILNFGWGLFRWINIYAVQPLFNFLLGTGLSTGIAILLLTIVLKLLLTPIQWKMYVSSAKMRIMKPEIDELNAKYPNKDDAMKKQMEMMSLYKESGASPLSGCVPMLIQMPILLAVFRFFPAAFELRQKGFLWAEDLSSYDSIWDFGVYIWPYGDHVSLFTLLMAGTTLIYTHINSGNMQQPQQPGMPNMKVIMYIFPIMMIFFFNNYSSGLSYYYFVSTLLSILLMILIKNYFVDEEKLKAKMQARKAAANEKGGKKNKKSKFQERLEQMQKMQQEKMKQNRR